MKRLYIVFFLLAGLSYAQEIPHKSTLTASKYEVKSDEEFTITYTLTDVEGYIYIGVQDGQFEVIGNSRWEGKIKEGEVKKLEFKVKLKKEMKGYITNNNSLSVVIGFSYSPLNEYVTNPMATVDVFVKVTDLDILNKQIKSSGSGTKLQYSPTLKENIEKRRIYRLPDGEMPQKKGKDSLKSYNIHKKP